MTRGVYLTQIRQTVNLLSANKWHQKVLQFARSKMDFVFGYDLCMASSYMQLHVLANHIEGYNNEIVITLPKLDYNAGRLVLDVPS